MNVVANVKTANVRNVTAMRVLNVVELAARTAHVKSASAATMIIAKANAAAKTANVRRSANAAKMTIVKANAEALTANVKRSANAPTTNAAENVKVKTANVKKNVAKVIVPLVVAAMIVRVPMNHRPLTPTRSTAR